MNAPVQSSGTAGTTGTAGTAGTAGTTGTTGTTSQAAPTSTPLPGAPGSGGSASTAPVAPTSPTTTTPPPAATSAPPGGAREHAGAAAGEPPAFPEPATKADAAAPAPLELPDSVKALGLDDAKAQQVAALLVSHEKTQQDNAEVELSRIQDGWKAGHKTDPILGGAEHATKMQAVTRACTRFMTAEERDEMDKSRMGDFRPFVRFAYRVGLKFSEDSIAGSLGNGTIAPDPDAQRRALYPNSPGMFSNS